MSAIPIGQASGKAAAQSVLGCPAYVLRPDAMTPGHRPLTVPRDGVPGWESTVPSGPCDPGRPAMGERP
jgi:hypothetical protein